jgi:hypothetical protein
MSVADGLGQFLRTAVALDQVAPSAPALGVAMMYEGSLWIDTTRTLLPSARSRTEQRARGEEQHDERRTDVDLPDLETRR